MTWVRVSDEMFLNLARLVTAEIVWGREDVWLRISTSGQEYDVILYGEEALAMAATLGSLATEATPARATDLARLEALARDRAERWARLNEALSDPRLDQEES